MMPLRWHYEAHDVHEGRVLRVAIVFFVVVPQGQECSVARAGGLLSQRSYRASPSFVSIVTPICAAQSGATSTIRGRLSEVRRMS